MPAYSGIPYKTDDHLAFHLPKPVEQAERPLQQPAR